jgi:hypothetical protein
MTTQPELTALLERVEIVRRAQAEVDDLRGYWKETERLQWDCIEFLLRAIQQQEGKG